MFIKMLLIIIIKRLNFLNIIKHLLYLIFISLIIKKLIILKFRNSFKLIIKKALFVILKKLYKSKVFKIIK